MAFYSRKNGITKKISGVLTTLLPQYTLEQYNALEHKPIFWIRTDQSYDSIPAEDISYDNTTSELTADDTQDAIDELAKPTFTEAETRTNIASGESFSTILGKIKKFFTDLKTVAFTGAYSDLSGQPDLTNVAYKNVNNNFTSTQTFDNKSGTTSTVGWTSLYVGNNKPAGTDGNTYGQLILYGEQDNYMQVRARNVTASRIIEFPDKTGTLALTSDITDVSTGTVTSSHTIEMGTSLKKNGKVVILTIQITLTSNVAQYESFASVPVGYRNSAYSYAMAANGHGVVMSGSNVNALGAIPTGTVVSCSFTYITND